MSTKENKTAKEPKADKVAGAEVHNVEPTSIISGPHSPSSSWDVMDFIPDSLKQAREQEPLPDDRDDEDAENLATATPKQKDHVQTDLLLDGEDYDEEPEKPKKEALPPKQEDVHIQEEGEEDSEEDLDLSDDALEGLLEGDPEALTAKKKLEEKIEKGEERFWATDKQYKKLLSRLPFGGVRKEELDQFIQDTLDKRVIDNSSMLEQVEAEKEALASRQEAYEAEIKRLKSIERSTRFDSMPETQEKYAKPMSEAGKEMRQLLEVEGVSDVSLHELLLAKDRAHFNKLLENQDLSSDSMQKLVNHWRNYKQLLFEYNNDKKEAELNLSKFLKTSISPESATNVLRNSLVDILQKNPKYQEIKEAINDDITKHPELSRVIDSSRASFMNFTKALSDPSSVVHDENWMAKFAEFLYDAAYNQYAYNKYQSLKEEHQATNEKLKKVVKAHQKLLKSAKGITGDRGVPTKARVNGAASRGRSQEAAKSFQDFLEHKKDFTDILLGD